MGTVAASKVVEPPPYMQNTILNQQSFCEQRLTQKLTIHCADYSGPRQTVLVNFTTL